CCRARCRAGEPRCVAGCGLRATDCELRVASGDADGAVLKLRAMRQTNVGPLRKRGPFCMGGDERGGGVCGWRALRQSRLGRGASAAAASVAKLGWLALRGWSVSVGERPFKVPCALCGFDG